MEDEFRECITSNMSAKRYQYLAGDQPNMVMRKRAEWMRSVDDQILEHLRDEGAGTPKSISNVLDKNNDYIGERCRTLTKYGLLNRPSRGFYLINDDGIAYLNEELDANELNPSES
ncbi:MULTISPECIES: winged helix-turn-helix domain-containing protein [unclassified Haloferax]|uniref:winged helix-turn-helix domain-containing protein n=1 Tax=unclassified Haloferax TaxID=2625095 RepID=UPI001F40D410|nr:MULTISPECIES: winged helix-turn-helix domain-containing protein [unclassified Haloferax]